MPYAKWDNAFCVNPVFNIYSRHSVDYQKYATSTCTRKHIIWVTTWKNQYLPDITMWILLRNVNHTVAMKWQFKFCKKKFNKFKKKLFKQQHGALIVWLSLVWFPAKSIPLPFKNYHMSDHWNFQWFYCSAILLKYSRFSLLSTCISETEFIIRITNVDSFTNGLPK